jgi:hypothetical protein
MLTALDELRHLADTLTEAEAERALAAIRAAMPELYPDDDGGPAPVTPDARVANPGE